MSIKYMILDEELLPTDMFCLGNLGYMFLEWLIESQDLESLFVNPLYILNFNHHYILGEKVINVSFLGKKGIQRMSYRQDSKESRLKGDVSWSNIPYNTLKEHDNYQYILVKKSFPEFLILLTE
jgi:hypothetical protein